MTSSDNGSPEGIVLTSSSGLVERQASVLIFELLTLIAISLALGKNLTPFAGFLLFLYWGSQKLHIYLSGLARAQAKEAQKRRSQEVAIISAAICHNVVQMYQQEKAELDELETSLEMREAALRAKEELTAAKMLEAEVAQVAKSQELREKEKELAEREKKSAKLMEESANKMATATKSLFRLSFPFSEYDPLASGFTCIGETREHRRCGIKFLPEDNRTCAANRLRLMQSSDPGNSFELDALTELADWMLCPQWHKPQRDRIAEQWHRDLLASASSQHIQQTPPPAHFSPESAGSSQSSIFSSAGRSSTASISPLSGSLTPSSDAEFWDSAARNLAPVFRAMSNK